MQLLYTPNEFGLGLSPDEITDLEAGKRLKLGIPGATGEPIFRIIVETYVRSSITIRSLGVVIILLGPKDLDYIARDLDPVVRRQDGVTYSIYNIGTFGEDVIDVEAVEVVDPVEEEQEAAVPSCRYYADKETVVAV